MGKGNNKKGNKEFKKPKKIKEKILATSITVSKVNIKKNQITYDKFNKLLQFL